MSDWNVGYEDVGSAGRGFGNFIPLVYTLPRKQLRLYGAPPSKYSKTHAIPDRPWGNEADEVFLTMEPGEYLPGKRQDISKERLRTDASKPILARIDNPEVSDEVLLMYAHHLTKAFAQQPPERSTIMPGPSGLAALESPGRPGPVGRDHLLDRNEQRAPFIGRQAY